LVAQAYIAQFYPVHTYNQTKIEIDYKDELFTASGRVELDLGWKALYTSQTKDKHEENGDNGDNSEEDDSASLPMMKKKDGVAYLEGEMSQKATKPPMRFTTSTLLAAMKDIHKFVKDPESKKKLKDVYGIGTEATRATIIDDLIRRRFMNQTGKKKYLQPTQSAYMLIDAMPEELSYPDFTAIWEDKLHSMADGDGSLNDFIDNQVKFTTELCKKAYGAKLQVASTTENGVAANVCPRCKSGVLVKRHGKNGDFWGCSAFPKCRMTCDDKDGKPDLEGAKSRNQRRSFGGGSTFSSGQSKVVTAAASIDESPFGNPYISEEEMAAFNQEFQLMDSFTASSSSGYNETIPSFGNPRNNGNQGGWSKDGPKASAAPMEHLSSEDKKADSKYLCPKCREGSLRRIKGRNGNFWGCSNYPRCTATFDDEKNMPVFN